MNEHDAKEASLFLTAHLTSIDWMTEDSNYECLRNMNIYLIFLNLLASGKIPLQFIHRIL